jgi:hypothetical protein
MGNLLANVLGRRWHTARIEDGVLLIGKPSKKKIDREARRCLCNEGMRHFRSTNRCRVIIIKTIQARGMLGFTKYSPDERPQAKCTTSAECGLQWVANA